jgi:hypothetical protein
MNKETFLKVSINEISQVYSGKRDCCRCGCEGDYVATTFMIKPRSADVNNKLVERRFKRAKKLVETGAEVDYGGSYVDVKTGNDRTLTFYFDEV